jgi:hypothetical protein
MTLSSLAPKNLACAGDFKAFRHCFLRFASCNRLWHKEPGNYALSWTWQGKSGPEGGIAAKETAYNSHKERKDRKETKGLNALFPFGCPVARHSSRGEKNNSHKERKDRKERKG